MGLTKPKIVGGVSLPDLTDPAAAADILSPKEAIAEDGAVLVGTHVCKQLHELFPALSNPAGAADVASGKQFVDSAGAVVSGTADPNEVTIEITFSSGSGNTNNYLKIDNTTYTKNTTLKVPKGTSIYVLTYDTSNRFDGKLYNTNEKTFIADCSYLIAFTTWGSTNGTVEITSQPNDSIVTGSVSKSSKKATCSKAKGKKNILIYPTTTGTNNYTECYQTAISAYYINGIGATFAMSGAGTASGVYTSKGSASWDSASGILTSSDYWHDYINYEYIAW